MLAMVQPFDLQEIMAPTFNAADFEGIDMKDSRGNPVEVDFELHLDDGPRPDRQEVKALVESILLRIEGGESTGRLYNAAGQDVGWFSTTR